MKNEIPNTKKIIIVGHTDTLNDSEIQLQLSKLKDEVQLIHVEKIEDLPEDLQINEIKPFILSSMIINHQPDIIMPYVENKKKRKGHERPYKYHK